MTIRTFLRRFLVDDHRLAFHHLRFLVTLVARYAKMSTLQGEMRPRVVVERRRNPSSGIVTIVARGLPGLRKLSRMGVFVAVLTYLSRAFELYLLLTHGYFVAIAALHSPVRTEQWELGLRVIESLDVCPGPHVVAGFTAERRAVGAPLFLRIFEFTMMRIRVASGAGHVVPAEREDLVGPAGGA